jgi:hypothetical protein
MRIAIITATVLAVAAALTSPASAQTHIFGQPNGNAIIMGPNGTSHYFAQPNGNGMLMGPEGTTHVFRQPGGGALIMGPSGGSTIYTPSPSFNAPRPPCFGFNCR